LVAQRTRMETIANNILNVNTTRNARGEPVPYRRRFVIFEPTREKGVEKAGVRVREIALDKAAYRKQFEPNHPDAIQAGPDKGYVLMPNIDLSTEYVNALEASR